MLTRWFPAGSVQPHEAQWLDVILYRWGPGGSVPCCHRLVGWACELSRRARRSCWMPSCSGAGGGWWRGGDKRMVVRRGQFAKRPGSCTRLGPALGGLLLPG